MNNKIRTLEYFKACPIDPFIEVFRVLNSSSHLQHENLLNDLSNIDEVVIEKFIKKNDYIISHLNLQNQVIRAYCLVDILQKEISKERINALCDKSLRPKPYNSKNLEEIEIDNNKLTSIKNFRIYKLGYQYNSFVYNLIPIIANRMNSSYWISYTIIKLMEEKEINFKIRLDPFIKEHKSNYEIVHQKMFVYGKPLNWRKLSGLKKEEYGQWIDEKINSEIKITDFVWRPVGNEIHFTCEELPKTELLNYRGSRFFHAIIDKATGYIKHCDGANRFYAQEEFKRRIKYHVRKAQVRKIGTRIKIFQIDDIIDQNTFTTLVASFFVWNKDVQKYFGNALK